MAKVKSVKTPKVNFPKTLYVFEQGELKDKFFLAEENSDCCDDGIVAVYGLIEVVNKSTKTILE